MLFEKLDVDRSKLLGFSEGARIVEKPADLQNLGFKRIVKVWEYPYQRYSVSRNMRGQAPNMNDYYQRVNDFSYYETENPILDKPAIVISNSFGAYTAKHFAPGYRKLLHVSTNNLRLEERTNFYRYLFGLWNNVDVIFVFQDHKPFIISIKF